MAVPAIVATVLAKFGGAFLSRVFGKDSPEEQARTVMLMIQRSQNYIDTGKNKAPIFFASKVQATKMRDKWILPLNKAIEDLQKNPNRAIDNGFTYMAAQVIADDPLRYPVIQQNVLQQQKDTLGIGALLTPLQQQEIQSVQSVNASPMSQIIRNPIALIVGVLVLILLIRR